MNAFRAVKSDFVIQDAAASSFRSRREAMDAALGNPDQPVELKQAQDPRVRIGAGEFIDMHKAGVAVDVVAQGRPYDAIMELSTELAKLGASQRATSAVMDMISRVAEEGSTFSKKFNAKPLYARVVVSDTKPDIPERCHIVAVTQIDANRILADDASKVTMQYTLYGTRMSMSRQMSVEEALGSHKKLDVWIIFGTLDEKDLNKAEQGGLNAADAALATLVEAVGPMGAILMPELREALKDGTASPEIVELVEAVAQAKEIVAEAQTPGALENPVQQIESVMIQVQTALESAGVAETIPPLLEKTVQAVAAMAEGQVQAARIEAMISPDIPSVPVADNDNAIASPVAAMVEKIESELAASSIAVASPVTGAEAPVVETSAAAVPAGIDAPPVMAAESPIVESSATAIPVIADVFPVTMTESPIVESPPVAVPAAVSKDAFVSVSPNAVSAVDGKIPVTESRPGAAVAFSKEMIGIAAPVVTVQSVAPVMPAATSVMPAPVSSAAAFTTAPIAKMMEPTFVVPAANTATFVSEIKASVPQTPATAAIVQKIQQGSPLTQTEVSRIVTDMGGDKRAVKEVNKYVVPTPETIRAFDIKPTPVPPIVTPPVTLGIEPPAPSKGPFTPPVSPTTPSAGPDLKNPLPAPKAFNPPAPPPTNPSTPPKGFEPPVAPPTENFDVRLRPQETPPGPPRNPEDRKPPEPDPRIEPNRTPRQEPRRDRNPEDINRLPETGYKIPETQPAKIPDDKVVSKPDNPSLGGGGGGDSPKNEDTNGCPTNCNGKKGCCPDYNKAAQNRRDKIAERVKEKSTSLAGAQSPAPLI
jgi:hypothetical protein